jgi:hypothetical protein
MLPESLGGDEWAVLPDGVICDDCNQFFGTKVERYALNSFPFLVYRLFFNIPTKKRRPPKMITTLGEVSSTTSLGYIGIEPINEFIEKAIIEGNVNQIRVPAYVQDEISVCRFLLKVGLEFLAIQKVIYIKDIRFEKAKKFARSPKSKTAWWFIMYMDPELIFSIIKKSFSLDEWNRSIEFRAVV